MSVVNLVVSLFIAPLLCHIVCYICYLWLFVVRARAFSLSLSFSLIPLSHALSLACAPVATLNKYNVSQTATSLFRWCYRKKNSNNIVWHYNILTISFLASIIAHRVFIWLFSSIHIDVYVGVCVCVYGATYRYSVHIFILPIEWTVRGHVQKQKRHTKKM